MFSTLATGVLLGTHKISASVQPLSTRKRLKLSIVTAVMLLRTAWALGHVVDRRLDWGLIGCWCVRSFWSYVQQ